MTIKKMNYADVYARFDIEYKAGKINVPVYGFRAPLLKKGNSKVGETVYTWSTLPGNKDFTVKIDGETAETVRGTCSCNCPGCYAQTGRYNCENVLSSLALNTVLIRLHPEFVKRALIAQITAEKIDTVRIDAAGDIEDGFITVFQEVVKACPGVQFWTYTKNEKAESMFNEYENANMVPSIIPGVGVNFGHCDYILNAYKILKSRGEKVHICRCGIDKNQHCENCRGCIDNKYVLFIEHSTSYKAEKDPAFPVLKEVIENQ